MKISTKGRYALRMLFDLAMHRNDGFVSLRDIAERQNISKKYLEQIVSILSHANLLKTSRGYQGGYMLSKEPYQYTLYEILSATEGSLEPVDSIELGNAKSIEETMEISVWIEFSHHIADYLKSITLQDVIDRTADYGMDYVI